MGAFYHILLECIVCLKFFQYIYDQSLMSYNKISGQCFAIFWLVSAEQNVETKPKNGTRHMKDYVQKKKVA